MQFCAYVWDGVILGEYKLNSPAKSKVNVLADIDT